MKHIKTFEGLSKSQFKIGDKVEVKSLEGKPTGKIYDITNHGKLTSYWVDLEKFGKMEFSDFEIKKLNNNEISKII